MALTESTMMNLGTVAPEFSLPDTDGTVISKSKYSGTPLLVMFICNHCPYVKHLANELASFSKSYSPASLGIVAIQSNDVENYPADSPELMKAEKESRGYDFPYLYDASQEVAKSYTAACTPDFFLFDADHRLVYRGRFDETRPKRIESGVYDSSENQPTGNELRAAVDSMLNGNPISEAQYPSLGCNIKWIEGNEPDYFG